MIRHRPKISRFIIPEENSRVGPDVGIEVGMLEGTTVGNLRSNSNPTQITATHDFLDSRHCDPVFD